MFASLALLLLLVPGQALPPDDLAVVRGHYAAAAYEEALAHITRLDATAVTPELEQFRALCLLALGRTEEGQQSFERLVRQAPLYVVPEAEISPRMYGVYRDVRRRVLPLIVRELYNKGKSSFDERRYDAAVVELREVMGLLNDPDAAADATTFADLRQLTDGFLRLAEAELALAARAAAPPPPPPATVEPVVTPPEATREDGLLVTRIVVYSRTDKDVVPPVELQRFMPPWNPPAAMRFVEYRGELEVIVDETGRVEDARMTRQTNPSYDLTLIGATAGWRFAPARRNGEPVKFRLTFEVVLAPNR
jgi:tetratricopeptide (TPR) repeat protein